MGSNLDFNKLKALSIGMEDKLNSLFRAANQKVSFPKKNIIQLDDDTYRIDFLLAGYSKDSIEIYIDEDNKLNIRSQKEQDSIHESEQEQMPRYILKEVAQRAFHIQMALIDVNVESANMENGILSIYLKKYRPDPKTVSIT